MLKIDAKFTYVSLLSCKLDYVMWKKKFVIVTYFVGHSKESLVTELQFLFLHPSLFPSRIECQNVCPLQILEGLSL